MASCAEEVMTVHLSNETIQLLLVVWLLKELLVPSGR
jgi:hypothetical protein